MHVMWLAKLAGKTACYPVNVQYDAIGLYDNDIFIVRSKAETVSLIDCTVP